MSEERLYLDVAIWSQVVSAILFIGALVFIWNKWIVPVVLAAQVRSNAQIAESERHRDEAKGALGALREEIDSARRDAELIWTARARRPACGFATNFWSARCR